MKINFSKQMFQLNGQPITNEDGSPSLLGDVCATALTGNGAVTPDPSEAQRRYMLAVQLKLGGVNVVSPVDVALLLGLLAATFAPLISGQAALLMDDDGEPVLRSA